MTQSVAANTSAHFELFMLQLSVHFDRHQLFEVAVAQRLAQMFAHDCFCANAGVGTGTISRPSGAMIANNFDMAVLSHKNGGKRYRTSARIATTRSFSWPFLTPR